LDNDEGNDDDDDDEKWNDKPTVTLLCENNATEWNPPMSTDLLTLCHSS
jgi:hypothetical protein